MSMLKRGLLCLMISIAMQYPVFALESVNIAYIGGTADVGFYIADAKGYLREYGIEAHFITFDSSARMIAPLSTGEIDIASGAINAATYNAFDRGITIKAVADKARNKGPFSYQSLVVRKDLWDNGIITSAKDFAGKKIVITAQGNNEAAVIDQYLIQAGLDPKSIDLSMLSMPQQVLAYTNKSLDVSMLAEPFLTAALKQNTIHILTAASSIRDNDVSGTILYSEIFAQKRPRVALDVMKAYLRGVRDYVSALKESKIAGDHADEIIEIISQYSSVKDKNTLRAITAHYVDPNGEIGVESLRADWAYFKKEKLINGNVSVDQIVDDQWIKAAVAQLGVY